MITKWKAAILLLTFLSVILGHIHKRKGVKNPGGIANGGVIISEAALAPPLSMQTLQVGENRTVAPEQREFIWFSNKAGIFSQFIQLKIMHYLMEKSKRVLTIAPSFSPHYGDTPIVLCNIFVLPDYINCPISLRMDSDRQCITHSISLDEIVSDKVKLCYQGPLPRLGARTPREAIIRGVDIPLPMRFQPNHTAAFEHFKAGLGISASTPYTVVHWRRGDQISTRCQQRKDQSINCGSAEELVALVRERTNHSLIYVATNEMPGSSEMEVLQVAGFKQFSDARMNPHVQNTLGVIETFLIEVNLMREATLFLGWGVSEVNDVVEFERRNAGKSWCSTAEDSDMGVMGAADLISGGAEGNGQSTDGTESARKAQDPTWCMLQLLSQRSNSSSVLFGRRPGGPQLANKKKSKALERGDGMGMGDGGDVSSSSSSDNLTALGSLADPSYKLPPQPVVRAFESDFNFSKDISRMFSSSTSSYSSKSIGGGGGSGGGGGMLPKLAVSKSKRLVVVVGLEGSGHDLLAAVLRACAVISTSSAPGSEGSLPAAGVCEKDAILSSMLLEPRGRGQVTGLWAAVDGDALNTVKLVSSIEGRLRRLNQSFATEVAKGHLVFAGMGASPSLAVGSSLGGGGGSSAASSSSNTNTNANANANAFGIGAGVGNWGFTGGSFSFPSGLWDRALSSSRPDLLLLAMLCERAGVDLRIVVVQRSAADITRAVYSALQAATPAGGAAAGEVRENAFARVTAPDSTHWRQSLVAGAASLLSELQLLDKAFFHCVARDDLGLILSSSVGRWGKMREAYKALVDFVHPTILPQAVNAALSARGGVGALVSGAGQGGGVGNNNSTGTTFSASATPPLTGDSSGWSSSADNSGGFYAQSAPKSAAVYQALLEVRVRQLAGACGS